jgi:hypothetical protein
LTHSFESIISDSRIPENAADYHVKHFPEGIVVYTDFGIPINTLASIGMLVPGQDANKRLAICLCPYYSKIFNVKNIYAIAKDDNALKFWEERVEKEIASMSGLSVFERWEIGIDTGISAKTMVQAAFPNKKITSEFGIPSDPDDFGRCMRAVDYFTSAVGVEDPDITKRFLDPANYVGKGEKWPNILNRWDELYTLGRKAGLSKRRSKWSKPYVDKLYEALKQIEYHGL